MRHRLSRAGHRPDGPRSLSMGPSSAARPTRNMSLASSRRQQRFAVGRPEQDAVPGHVLKASLHHPQGPPHRVISVPRRET